MASDANGAVFWNMLYPWHVHLPAGAKFPATVSGINCIVVIVEHREPVVVTDFDNDLVRKKVKTGVRSQLKKPIPYRPENTIAIDFHSVGNPVQQHAFWTKDHLYQIYRKQSFTEITVGVECRSEESPESNDLGLFKSAIDRFMQLYRVAANDPKASSFEQLENNSPVVRRAYVAYPSSIANEAPVNRLIAALPSKFPHPVQFRIQEFAEDAVRLIVNREDLAVRIGHHFAVGTTVTESQDALLNCFALLKKSKNYRYAVIDAFSVAEVVAFDLVAEARVLDLKVKKRFDGLLEKKGRVTIQDVVKSFLPHILKPVLPKYPGLIGNIDRSRKIRHSAMHERENSSSDDAELVLNSAQQLMFAVEEWRNDQGATYQHVAGDV